MLERKSRMSARGAALQRALKPSEHVPEMRVKRKLAFEKVPASSRVSTGSGAVDGRGIDVIFWFETTGSVYPCLTQVRRNISDAVARLTAEIPEIRIAVIAHGGHCDLIDRSRAVERFISETGSTFGSDAPEAYRKALHEARGLFWAPDSVRSLTLDQFAHVADMVLALCYP